jgi:hypothetical protein
MSSAGVYGLVSYLVSQRTREIAIRAAIGAQQRSLYWLVSRQTVVSTCLGVAVGLAAAVALAGLLTRFTVIGRPDRPILAGIAILHLDRAGRDIRPRPPHRIQPEAGWTHLFNGRDFTGWRVSKPESFKVENGAIATNGRAGHAYYDGPFLGHRFRNFELKVDVMVKANANGGSNGGVYILTELQELFFPEGIAFDRTRFNRTTATAPLFNYLAPSESADERVVSRTGIEPAEGG